MYNLPVLDPWFPHEYTKFYGFWESGRYPLHIKFFFKEIIFELKLSFQIDRIHKVYF